MESRKPKARIIPKPKARIMESPKPKARFIEGPKRKFRFVRHIGDRLPSEARSLRMKPQEDPVAAGVARATKAWKKYWSNRDYDRDAVYGYLSVVFDVMQEWEEAGMAGKCSLAALKQVGSPIRMKPDPYARLILCSSSVIDPKMRSKWARVLRYAAESKKQGESFSDFVKRKGGINECAALAAFDTPPRKKR
jgi:hypothetical protein